MKLIILIIMRHHKYYGEQNFVYDTCIENNTKITKMSQWIAKYDKEHEKNLRYNQMFIKALMKTI